MFFRYAKHQTEINEPLSYKIDLDKAASYGSHARRVKQYGNLHTETAIATNWTRFACSFCFAFQLAAQALLCSENLAAC